jgi:hypothetical protein
MFKEAHDQIDIERGHSFTIGNSLDLEIVLGVEGEVVVDEDKLDEFDKELSGL